MIKKTLHYHDLEDLPRTGDFYFHLSKADLVEWKLVKGEEFEAYIQKIVDDKNGGEIIKTFKEIIAMSYGKKSDDGITFLKSAEQSDAFMHTDAYSELFMELVTNADAAAVFIRGIMPADLGDHLPKEIPNDAKVTHLPTPKDYHAMSRDELEEAMRQMAEGKQ